MRLELPLIHRGNRLVAVIVGAAVLVGFYQLPARLQFRPTISLDQSFVDSWIPFLEWTIWFYASEYLLVILAIWLAVSDLERSRAFYALILASAVGLVIFTLWPTAVGRQSPTSTGLTGQLWRWLYAVDTSANALPSLHAANTCIAAVCIYRLGRAWRFVAPVWATSILVSTLTTKQHYVIDIVGGIALAALCHVLVRAYLRFRLLETMSLGGAPVRASMKWADRVVAAVIVSFGGALLAGALLSVAQLFVGMIGALWRD
jgi:membrane-associated phospholipid phosphatase